MSALSRETLELISSWAEVLTALFGILAATCAVVYLLANKPIRKLEQHDNEVLQANVADARKAQQSVELELVKQQERTAKAEKAASDAALALAKFKEPRVLSKQQSSTITAKVKPFRVKFDVAASNNSETLNLVVQIEDLLKAAGWEEVDWPFADGNLVHSRITRPGRVSIGLAIEHGVSIQVKQPEKEELFEIAKTLASAFSAEGVSARAEFMAVDQSNQHTIHIVVGEKAVP